LLVNFGVRKFGTGASEFERQDNHAAHASRGSQLVE
jgi:hypothetical protein